MSGSSPICSTRLGTTEPVPVILAESYAREALAIDSTQTWIKTDLVTSILFQGRYAEAEKIALEIKDEEKDSILEDLKTFEEQGVIPEEYKADVERLREVLNRE